MAPPPPSTAASFAQRWGPILAGLADAALLLDPAGHLVACTRAARSLLGAAADQAGARASTLLGLPRDDSLEGEAILRPPATGLEVVAQLRRTPLFDAQGRLEGHLLLLVDATVGEAERPAEQIERRLREVALTISSALDIERVLDQVLRLAIELLGASGGSLPIYDARFERLLPSHVLGVDAPVLRAPFYRGGGKIWGLIDTGEPILTNSYRSDPQAVQGLLDAGVRAVVAVAVRAGEQLMGVLSLYHTVPERRFTRRDLELLEMIGRHAGLALQNAARYREAIRESHRRYLLYQASLAFGAALEPERLYATIHHTVTELMPCDTIAIALLDAPAHAIDYVYLADSTGRWPSERLPVTRGLLGTIIRGGIAVRITGCDPELEAMFGAEPFGEGEDATGSLLAVPLPVGEQIIGAITVQAVAHDAYGRDDLDVLETLAATVAIALQNACLFARVHELATTDPLTGVANRRHFFDLAGHEVERAARYGHPLSLLMIDADHFKRINDQFGHAAGDEVLRVIAARCRASLREADLIGRYGGEEFLVLLPETASAQAFQVADRLRELVGAAPVATAAGPVAVQISVGVATLPAGASGSVESLLDQVDRALYGAKAGGRNQARAS